MLSRFIPQAVADRTLNREDFLTVLARDTTTLLTDLQLKLDSGDKPLDFEM